MDRWPPTSGRDQRLGIRRGTSQSAELIRPSADLIKIASSGGVLSPRGNPRHGQFREDDVRVIVAEAEAAGLKVFRNMHGKVVNTLALDILDGQIQTIRSVINPRQARGVR